MKCANVVIRIKVGQIINPGITSRIIIRCTYDKNLKIALFVFSVLAPWWLSHETDQTEICSRDTYVLSYRSISPAVTKCAVVTEDR
jgi:hypothetical protein